MKKYMKMIVFVIVLGTITSGVFVGMEAWTGPLIQANAANEIKSTILDANGISYTMGNINEVFEENITIQTIDGFEFFIDNTSGSISFEFEGGGVWGPIEGMITLQRDKETIRSIRVLQQEETPGLGGVVATVKYLNQFEGIKMVPALEINIPDANANKPNEVDTITGATRTSKAFEEMLNVSYSARLNALAKIGG